MSPIVSEFEGKLTIRNRAACRTGLLHGGVKAALGIFERALETEC